MFERLLAYFKSHAGVRFDTMENYVKTWREANPVEAWVRANADIAGTHALRG
jgi:hypothetical protein